MPNLDSHLAPADPRPLLTGRRLWWTWLIWVSAGETIGFCVPALVGALTARFSTVVSLPSLLAAGAAEGALLGAAQAHVLRRALPGLPSRHWIAATSGAAVVAWLVGMLPSSAADTLAAWPAPALFAAGAIGAAVLLLSIGGAQWTVLRRHLGRATPWIWISAAGWLAGLAAFLLVATPLWREGQPIATTAAIGVLAGLVMAATVAAITGAGLQRLVRRGSS